VSLDGADDDYVVAVRAHHHAGDLRPGVRREQAETLRRQVIPV
jgi:hypothetical protein